MFWSMWCLKNHFYCTSNVPANNMTKRQWLHLPVSWCSRSRLQCWTFGHRSVRQSTVFCADARGRPTAITVMAQLTAPGMRVTFNPQVVHASIGYYRHWSKLRAEYWMPGWRGAGPHGHGLDFRAVWQQIFFLQELSAANDLKSVASLCRLPSQETLLEPLLWY